MKKQRATFWTIFNCKCQNIDIGMRARAKSRNAPYAVFKSAQHAVDGKLKLTCLGIGKALWNVLIPTFCIGNGSGWLPESSWWITLSNSEASSKDTNQSIKSHIDIQKPFPPESCRTNDPQHKKANAAFPESRGHYGYGLTEEIVFGWSHNLAGAQIIDMSSCITLINHNGPERYGDQVKRLLKCQKINGWDWVLGAVTQEATIKKSSFPKALIMLRTYILKPRVMVASAIKTHKMARQDTARFSLGGKFGVDADEELIFMWGQEVLLGKGDWCRSVLSTKYRS